MSKDNYYVLSIENEFENYARDIYWPVYRWEVSMPMLPKDNLNSFERLFLELATCSVGLTFDIVKNFGISEVIYKRVCKHLYDKNFLDKNNVLTDSGKLCIDNKNYFNEAIITARAERRVFLQDAISGDIIPYLINTELISRELPSEDKDSLWELDSCDIKKPAAQDILTAIKLAYQFKENEKREADGNDQEIEQQKQESDFDINQETDSKIEMVQAIRFINTDNYDNKFFVKCNISVNPLFVTNNNLDSIWTIKSPFGTGCNEWLGRRLRIRLGEDRVLSKRVCDTAYEIRESMRGNVAFRNDLNIGLFNDFPLIANDEKYKTLKEKIELLELVNQSIDTATLEDLWRIRLANAIDRIMKFHLWRLSLSQRQAVASWVSEHKNDFKKQIGLLLDKYNITYQYRENNYINNPNINAENMLRIANKNNKAPYKKDIAIFMLIAANCAEDTCWGNLIKQDNTVYEKIALIDFWRNKNAAHDSDAVQTLTGKDRDTGMRLLRELISAYFEEVKA